MKKIVITGSSGRIGRALYWQLSQAHQTKGMDISTSSSTDIIGDIRDYDTLLRRFEGIDTVFHSAALHAPHVDLFSEREFHHINVSATEKICKAAIASGVSQLVFTSTSALYGYANQEAGKAVWVNEQTVPQPKTIYHKTKLEAEKIAESYSGKNLSISVIRMSRCFPEPAETMAVYRLHRGIDYRDVAEAHVLAAKHQQKKDFEIYVVSGASPFLKSDCVQLYEDPESLIRERCPHLAREFDKRGWKFPDSIDRVYDSTYCQKELGWKPEKGPLDVLKQYDDRDFEILPPS